MEKVNRNDKKKSDEQKHERSGRRSLSQDERDARRLTAATRRAERDGCPLDYSWSKEVEKSSTLDVLTEGRLFAKSRLPSRYLLLDDSPGSVPKYKDSPFFAGIDGQTAIFVYGGGVRSSYQKIIDSTLERLKEAKLNEIEIELAGVRWTLRRCGSGGYGYYMALDGAGLSLQFTRTPGETDGGAEIPVCKVVWGWFLASSYDPRQVVQILLEYLQKLGCVRLRYHITRLDIQVTTTLFKMSDVAAAIRENRVVSMVRPDGFGMDANGNFETFLWKAKAGGWECRIYDKTKEVLAKGNTTKAEFLADIFRTDSEWWNMVRVEFQLLRDFLRDKGVTTFDDLYIKGQSLITYLMSRCVRILEKPKGNNHSNRVSPAPFWLDVSSMFLRFFRGTIKLNPKKQKCPGILLDKKSKDSFKNMAVSYLVKLAADLSADKEIPVIQAIRQLTDELTGRIEGKTYPLLEREKITNPAFFFDPKPEFSDVQNGETPF